MRNSIVAFFICLIFLIACAPAIQPTAPPEQSGKLYAVLIKTHNELTQFRTEITTLMTGVSKNLCVDPSDEKTIGLTQQSATQAVKDIDQHLGKMRSAAAHSPEDTTPGRILSLEVTALETLRDHVLLYSLALKTKPECFEKTIPNLAKKINPVFLSLKKEFDDYRKTVNPTVVPKPTS